MQKANFKSWDENDLPTQQNNNRTRTKTEWVFTVSRQPARIIKSNDQPQVTPLDSFFNVDVYVQIPITSLKSNIQVKQLNIRAKKQILSSLLPLGSGQTFPDQQTCERFQQRQVLQSIRNILMGKLLKCAICRNCVKLLKKQIQEVLALISQNLCFLTKKG